MEYLEMAEQILKAVGGSSNVTHLEHCSTRLRFSLVDKSKADAEKLEQIKGVVGVVINVQCQIVIGHDVMEVYDALLPLLETKKANTEGTPKNKIGSIILDYIISIFQPLIPAIAGGGILKSLLLLLNMIGILQNTTQTYKILYFIGDAPLYYLPLLVAITTAKKLKVNQLVSVAAVVALLTPGLAGMLKEGTSLFGIHLTNISYAYQVFPAILCTIFYAFLERFFSKISPKVIRGFFVPMMSLLIAVPVTLLILGPLGFIAGQGFSAIIMFIFKYFGWIAVAILAACLPFMVVTGMHKAMIPYVVSALGETGKELIYNAASLAHNISEGGAMFAVALRTKDKDERTIAVSSGISALFGITEPALYSITIQKRRVLYSVMIGSFLGGAYLGIKGVEAYVAVGPGLASLSMFISETLPNNIIHAIIGLIISFVTTFIAVTFLWKNQEITADNKETITNTNMDKDSIKLVPEKLSNT
ncbi:PTS transporter subunit EIIC [Sebaldella termitidis]|uniref:PTS transporter subunit EIIC n=1 Tax=Sebaldella termitidis TaxID=826 RepID=UPI003EB74CE0